MSTASPFARCPISQMKLKSLSVAAKDLLFLHVQALAHLSPKNRPACTPSARYKAYTAALAAFDSVDVRLFVVLVRFTEAYPRPACAWRDTPTMAAEHVMRDADTQEEQQYVMLGGDCASNANLIVSNAIKSFQNVEIALRRCDAVGASEWLDRARRCWKASGRCKSEIAQRMEGLKAEIGKLDQGSSGGSSFDYLKQVHGAQPVTVGGSVGLVRDAATHRRGEGRKYAPLASHKQKAWLSSQLESPRCRQSESPLPEMLARLGLNVRGDSEAWQIVPSQESPLGSPTVGKVIPGPLFIPPTLDKAPLALPRGKTSSNNSLEPLIRKFEGMQAGSTTPRGRVDVLASPRGRQGSPLPMQPLHSPRGGVTLPPAEIPNSLPPTRPPSLIMDVVDALDKADSTTQTSDSPKGSQAFDRPAQATPTKGTPNKHVVPMLSIPPPAHDAAVSSRSNAGDFTDRSGKAGRGQLMIQGRRIPGLLEGLVALVGGSDVFDQRPS